MAKSTSERQAAFRARKKALGLVPVSGMVHPSQLADLQLLIERLASDRNLEVTRNVRHIKTLRFCSL